MEAKILIIDHNDSFTFNLVQMLEEAGVAEVRVIRADQVNTAELKSYDGIVLSPGPGLPGDYPNTAEVIRYCAESAVKAPLLGVCLGFQAIVLYFGGKLLNLKRVQHGKQVTIDALYPCPLLASIRFPMEAGLYHSWSVDTTVPTPSLRMTACLHLMEDHPDQKTAAVRQVPMSFRHNHLPIFGVQFHPESYMTPSGEQLINNWLRIVTSTRGNQISGIAGSS